MADFSPAQIKDFIASRGWQEVVSRLEGELKKLDTAIENPDSFEHGRAVGERRALRFVLTLPQQLLREAEGVSLVRKLR